MFRPSLTRGVSVDSADVSGYARSRRASLSAEQRRKLSMLRSASIPSPLTPVSHIYHLVPCPRKDCNQKYVVSTDRSGDIHVHVQGDLSQQDKRCVFLTVHDLGTNHSTMVDFVNSPAMSEIKERSCFIHVDVPGHEEGSPDLPDSYQFPSLQTLGEDLITVLDFLHVRYAVGLGEGAGANVLARCGLAHPRRLLGLILVNCTASTSSVADAFRSRFSRWRGADISQSEEDFLIYHKFGHQISSDSCEAGERDRMLTEYRSRLRGNLNTHNIKQYVRAFINRKDLVLRGCQPDILLITGMLSPYSTVIEKMYKELDKERVTILKVDRAGDVLAETPAKIAQSLLLFCQGQGLLTSLPPPGVERRMSRAMSMEEYDKPNIRRLSLTPAQPDSPHRKL
ncbi:uncharacterized protein ZK1073.1 isoform X1 [Helicoverpa armigera]|uniref:uncharacterized protein ZK1073.1 isoform X6 n=1 Tax=Helicoverpa zea TaxID=7113 RepID=UPI000B3A5E99|nr:uncharacterized protein ZK1073.1 isoform X6 [Helicoverpa zea]XP_049702802.1 uncharacterized protein ZK1073.1 isoform X1 [Helicoverpa armigera]PZC83935.1 hypothetical protein B5X24_HaOG206684 [Helicoverpa armigera]